MFLFFFLPNGTKKQPSRREMRAEKSLRERFHSDSEASSWGRGKRGACGRICLSLRRDRRRGQRRTAWREETAGGAEGRAATCFSDSAGLRKPLLLC